MEINIQDISFSYGSLTIIKDLTCKFLPGKFYALCGPNGSGKTSLLDLVYGYKDPDKGSVLAGRHRVSQLSVQTKAKIFSLVSQNYYINFPFSVKEVVMMGRHPYIGRFSHPSQADMDRVNQVMDATGISHLMNRKINELSGGEKQRCIFARTLCQNTPVLLLDEAFSSMDINHTLHLLGIVKKTVQEMNKTVICVLHDLNLASAWADELVFLKKGEIIAMGESQQVMTRENIKNVFKVKSKVEFNEYVQAKQVCFKKN